MQSGLITLALGCAVLANATEAGLQAWRYSFVSEVTSGSFGFGLDGSPPMQPGDEMAFAMTIGADVSISEWTLSGPGYSLSGTTSSFDTFLSGPDEGEGEEIDFFLGFQPFIPVEPGVTVRGITVGHFPNRFFGDEPYNPGWKIGDPLPAEFTTIYLPFAGTGGARIGPLTLFADVQTSAVEQIPSPATGLVGLVAVQILGRRRR